ncbi:hypothetical protein HYY70_00405 [Candidatus Woesearchaeota archaeon]|nr:hypothetical protein [Candidatus Woesearchaeota archaeon]
MKLGFEAEDAVIGIICGLLLVTFTGRIYPLKLHNSVYAVAFIVFIIFIFLDIINEFKDLTSQFGLIALSILHNLVDLAISLAFISHFTGWNIPYITPILVPYLQSEAMILGIGVFLVASNVLWLITMPFWT